MRRTPAALADRKTKLTKANVKLWEEGHGDQQSIYFADPNNIVWEITAPPSKPATSAKSARKRAEDWIAARTHTIRALIAADGTGMHIRAYWHRDS